jgi:hypothetical protein
VKERAQFLSRLNFITNAKMGENASVLSEILLKVVAYWDVLHNLTMTGVNKPTDGIRCVARQCSR